MQLSPAIPGLFEPLHQKFMELLRSLEPADWEKPTVARLWNVKDVASHLLDGSLRTLSLQRDRYFGDKPPAITGYDDLVGWLNQLNADWVKASKRLSPQVIILLHEVTGPLVNRYFASLPPDDPAIFAVSWAGEEQSRNQLHIAREYTEKWLHQQQIRDAVNRPGIMTREFYYPFIDTFMRGLPHACRHVQAPEGSLLKLTVETGIGGSWFLLKNQKGWELVEAPGQTPTAEVSLDPGTAWKMFSKSLRPQAATDRLTVKGDRSLAEAALNMVSVMA